MPESPVKSVNSARPDCWKCQHFSVSWDPKLPYLCRLMGFKSRSLPALEIIRADGKPCQGFTAKAPAQAVPAAPAVAPVQANPSTYLSAFRR